MSNGELNWFEGYYDINNTKLEHKYLKEYFKLLIVDVYGQEPFPESIKTEYNTHLRQLMNKEYNIIDCYKRLNERFDLGDFEINWKNCLDFVKNRIEKFNKLNPISKPRIKLTGLGRRIIDFSIDVGKVFERNEAIFYKPKEFKVVEISDCYDKMLDKTVTMFQEVDSKRFINILENSITTYITLKDGGDVIKSPTKSLSELVLCNDEFVKSLYKINRFLKFPLPFIDKETKELVIPKKGYDISHEAYFTSETPDITLISVDEAKKLISDILSGFCFKDDIDKIMAIAYLITPCCRGLYTEITERTPLFLIKANRERAGKDYLAGVVGIIYEGKPIDDTPISDGEKGKQSNDELRKKITAGLIQGRRRFHSSNNKGFLNNSTFEQILTSKTHRDRVLGHTKEVELDNEMEFSLSANWGLTYTADLWHRCRPINLFFSEEDPNERIFKIPDLHNYVTKNREKVLSAIITLIQDWVNNGMKSGSVPFTSFPEWARVVGGVMEHHEFGSPCIKVEDDDIGGDKTTEDFKKLVEYMYEVSRTGLQKKFVSKDIIDLLAQNQQDWDIFTHLDLINEPKTRGIMGKIISNFKNRYFSEIFFKCEKYNKKANQWKYMFEKKDDGIVVDDMIKKDKPPQPPQEKEHIKLVEGKPSIDLNERIKYGIVEAEEEIMELSDEKSDDDQELIHLKCNICGLTPCKSWSKTGKPLCELCGDKK